MKSSKFKMTTFLLALTLSTGVFAAHRVGNGTGDVELAYTNEQGQTVQLAYNLDHLKLTAKQIKKRDKKIDLADFYKNATVGKTINMLEKEFGVDIYHHNRTKNNFYIPNLKSTEDIMDSAIRYYINPSAYYNRYSDAFVVSNGVFDKNGNQMLYHQDITIEKRADMNMVKISRTDRFPEVTQTTPFLLVSQKNCYQHCAIYSTLEEPLFSMPIIGNFFDAMKNTQLRGLDATVVFANGTVINDRESLEYSVIYPELNKYSPIPKPVIFISSSADSYDLEEMLNEHAPQIYAYNKLFDQRMLPQLAELTRALEKHPTLTRDLEIARDSNDLKTARMKVVNAFLKVNYMILTGAVAAITAPITLPAMLANPRTYNIFIAVF